MILLKFQENSFNKKMFKEFFEFNKYEKFPEELTETFNLPFEFYIAKKKKPKIKIPKWGASVIPIAKFLIKKKSDPKTENRKLIESIIEETIRLHRKRKK